MDLNHGNIYEYNKFIQEKILPKYFNVPDVNLLRVGMLGYISELAGNTAEANAFKISELFNEINPLQAKLPETIFNNASFVRYEDFFAKPSKIPISLNISEDILLKNAMATATHSEVIIDKDSEIEIGKYTFMLDFDIIIIIKKYGDKFIYTAQYNIKDNDKFQEITNPYIRTYTSIENGNERFLHILVEVRQVKRIHIEKEITTNDIIDMMSFDVDFQGDLAYFDVYYKTAKEKEFSKLKKLLPNYSPIQEKFCYYKYVKKDIANFIKIYFSDRLGYFFPEFNSQFNVDLFITEGEKGNFTYSGNEAYFYPKSDKYNYDKLIVFVTVLGDAIGAKSLKTLDQINVEVGASMTTMNSVNSENDLNTYFKNKSYNDIKFFKKRDDFLKRVYSAFLLLKDSNTGKIFHTNTLDIIINKSDFNIDIYETRKAIKTGTQFKYIDEVSKNEATVCEATDDIDSLDFVYVNPYMLVVDFGKSSLSVYKNNINAKLKVVNDYVNNSSYVQPIINYVNITRDAIYGSNDYEIEINVMMNTDLSSIFTEQNVNYDDRIKLVIELGYSNYIRPSIYSIDEEEGVYTFKTTFTTDDYISEEGDIRIVNSLFSKQTNLIEPVSLIPMNGITFKLYAFIKYDENVQITTEYSNKFGSEFEFYTLSNIYYNVDPMNLIESLNKYINTQVKFFKTTVTDEDYKIKINSIPLIRGVYTVAGDKIKEIYESIDTYIGYISEIIALLNNFNVDLKLFNTYGRSKFFSIDKETDLIDRNNISISYRIKLKSYLTINIDDFKKKVKNFIITYIENINNSSNNNIYISNLSSAIEKEFEEILYIIFVGMNSYDSNVQKIEMINADIEKMSYDEISHFVPEYLNISDIYSGGGFIPEIYIDII